MKLTVLDKGSCMSDDSSNDQNQLGSGFLSLSILFGIIILLFIFYLNFWPKETITPSPPVKEESIFHLESLSPHYQ